MTEERSNNVSDPLVSRAYRESANETAPAALDDAVLRDAKQAVSGNAWDRYSKSIHWLRPMAWAATVALSLAIVIEVTDVPYLSQDRAVEETPPMPELPQAESAPAALDANMPAQPPARSAPTSAGGTGELRLQSSEMKVEADAIPATVKDGLAADVAERTADTEIFRNQNAEMLKEAEEQMRLRASDQPVSTEEPRASAAYLLAVPCDEEETSEPETWMECIERLDEAGRYADAERQRDLLKEAFPDFEPDTNND